MVTGKCECGKVQFQVEAVRDSVTVCHCSQCRRTSGHVWASTVAPESAVTFTIDDGLEWYASSHFAKRGFCKGCGSSLFYKIHAEDYIAIAAGCLDEPNDLHIGKHIFVKDKGDYYEITDDAPQIQRF
ncbi:GFA family protein [Pseudovibrio sp. JE062]|uniref:GFA family protein n=1 Tax=Pseudovibrio sp. JE062 TaxID=439495 RepID=UPI000186BE8E|nr:GFA family protein [Pseudovibrio sp. JE062]EEA91852.1 glutathione-dependent formaldehyde-activating, GFA [Pseudovibrio sp. JE062]